MDKETRSVFEELQTKTGCSSISDLRFPPLVGLARTLAADMDMSGFSCRELTDLAEYLYCEKVPFASTQQARDYFATGPKKK